MTNKQKYVKWINNQEDIPILFPHWHLDAIALDSVWYVVLYEENDTIRAVFPYCFKKKMGFTKIIMPSFCPYLGPWIKYPTNATEYERRSLEKKRVVQAWIKDCLSLTISDKNYIQVLIIGYLSIGQDSNNPRDTLM
ncbi:MAG: hypothetical protein IPP53_13895 [Bacteroidetes bacterium]|nr:hypothetical protein [Bacteroidota bacterium]